MGCNHCTCSAPATQARALAIVGSQLGMVGLRVRGHASPEKQLRSMGAFGDAGTGDWTMDWSGYQDYEASKKPYEPEEPGKASGSFGGGTTPGSVPVVGAAWDLSTSPAVYTTQSGDTFTGLAKTYLPSSPPGLRWKEIWQPNASSHPDPNKLGVGDKLTMPDEATANAKKALAGSALKKPGGGPSLLAWVVGGAVVAAAGTGIAYGVQAMNKKRRARAASGA